MTDPHSPIRTYVLDTSVLLSDPWACTRFAEHEVIVPLVVISELEGKRHHHELGWFARQALRLAWPTLHAATNQGSAPPWRS